VKPGLQIGRKESITITVTDDMCPAFGGQRVHPTLSTVSMVYYMEWVGRLIILPFLQDDEEGVGVSISIEHLAPAPIDKKVTFFAEATEIRSNKVVCHVWAEHDKALVGKGDFVQAILPKNRIYERIESMN
jgi:fluoroacetyl-CoA thioesterase